MERGKNLPEFPQNELVAKAFRCLHAFTDDEITELTEFYRALWMIEQNYDAKQTSRLELLKIMIAVKIQKIEMEKRVLQNKIDKLDLI